jgi:rRNA maturation RNase YbeY|tara:strand:+ start:40086 stop:40508 length:423 start_codon:yes stop_codon:yes gene_type:complete
MIVFQNKKLVEDINFFELSKWLEQIIIREKKVSGDIVCVFCDDKYLLEKNIKYLNHDYLTDVITFNYCEDITISGDLLISVERVRENAKHYNVSFFTEIKRVIVHGLLHLLGYDDKTNSSKQEMTEKEDFYLNLYNDFRR